MTEQIILDKKPLVEAIFEVRWELTGNNTFAPGGPSFDPLYDVMIGALREKLKADFPEHVRLQAADVPGMMMPYQPQHQFRASHSGWPLVQLGSGVLTINETEGYTSAQFIPMCLRVMAALMEFWRENNSTPRVTHVALRYIDAIRLNGRPIAAILEKLGVNVGFGEKVHRSGRLDKAFSGFEFASRMKSFAPQGSVDFVFNNGAIKGDDALIWQTTVSADGELCAAFNDSPEKWLLEAHQLAHDLFFSMIEGELLKEFQ